jgi:hypothetical protein
MIEADRQYLQGLLSRGLLAGPVLELGAQTPDQSARDLIEGAGLGYVGTDIEGDVDVVVDFSDAVAVSRRFATLPPFASALVFNVLEHTFDPIRVLDNVFGLLAVGGICVVLTPTVWPLHSFPIDCWRILPDFYQEYARRNGHELLQDTFEYVGKGPVITRPDAPASLPMPGRSRAHLLYSRVIHKIFNTAGRSMFMPSHVATAVAFRKGPAPGASPRTGVHTPA